MGYLYSHVRLLPSFRDGFHAPVHDPYFEGQAQQYRGNKRNNKDKYIDWDEKYNGANSEKKDGHTRQHAAKNYEQKAVVAKAIGKGGGKEES
jgi:hypothetical protein